MRSIAHERSEGASGAVAERGRSSGGVNRGLRRRDHRTTYGVRSGESLGEGPALVAVTIGFPGGWERLTRRARIRQSVFMRGDHENGQRRRRVAFLAGGTMLVAGIGIGTGLTLTRSSGWHPTYVPCITHGLNPGHPPNECLVNARGSATTVVFPLRTPDTTATTTLTPRASTVPEVGRQGGASGPMITVTPTTAAP